MARHNKTGWAADATETEGFVSSLPALYGDQLEGLPFDRDKSAWPFRHLVRSLAGSKHIKGGRLQSINQGNVGSCVGCMGSRVADLVAAADIHQRHEPERWPTDQAGRPIISSPEYCYGASRQVVDALGRWDGSTGSSMARALKEIGTAYQKTYSSTDLTRYSAARARSFARRGVPEPVLAAAREHPFRASVRVESRDQAVALLQNGYAVGICSGLAFSSRRDRDGFARRVRPGWSHAMTIAGYLAGTKPGFLVLNSWGAWNSGGAGLLEDMPVGGFLAHWSDLAGVLRPGSDCFSYGGFRGFAASPFNWEGGLGW